MVVKGKESAPSFWEAIEHYRRIASKELEERRDRSPNECAVTNRSRILPQDYVAPVHRFFVERMKGPIAGLVELHRALVYGLDRYYGPSTRILVLRRAGYELGRRLVERGAVKSLDDVPRAFLEEGIGILDLIYESLNRMTIRIYECISCASMPSIGEVVCDFEAGMIHGVLEALIGANKVIEKYCWGLGYSFCEFIVEFL